MVGGVTCNNYACQNRSVSVCRHVERSQTMVIIRQCRVGKDDCIQ